MPNEGVWKKFFDVDLILSSLKINGQLTDIVEVGCGYGTFTIPVAKQVKGTVYAFDIEQAMVDVLQEKLREERIGNIIVERRDIVKDSSGLGDNSVDYVMLFNILHHDFPLDFLNEAHRILRPGGMIGVIHWRSDITTPCGPTLAIRPSPDQILDWIDKRFLVDKMPFIIPPYHYGLLISKL